MDHHQIITLSILVVLIILSGFFSASETALTAFKRINLKTVEEEDPTVAKLLKIWIKRPNEILIAILLGNNIVNILATSISTVFVDGILQDRNIGGNASIFIVTPIMTVIVLIFGEITPKIIAKNYSRMVSKIVIKPMYYLMVVFLPIIIVLKFISKVISRILFGIKISNESSLLTEEDIKSMINVGEEEGVLEEEAKEMLHSIFEFGDSTVREVMIPRSTMFAIDGDKKLLDVWDELIEKGYSRVPVYEEKIDNIVGIVYIKDLVRILKDGKLNTPVKELVRKAYFIPETKHLSEQLAEFQQKRTHIAIVLDEYGGVAGLVTIEDLIEEIVGEIEDEFDDEEEKIIVMSDGKYNVDAMLDISTLNKELELNIPDIEDYDTLGGYIYYIMGKVPVEKEIFYVEGNSYKILTIDSHRIVRVLIEKGVLDE